MNDQAAVILQMTNANHLQSIASLQAQVMEFRMDPPSLCMVKFADSLSFMGAKVALALFKREDLSETEDKTPHYRVYLFANIAPNVKQIAASWSVDASWSTNLTNRFGWPQIGAQKQQSVQTASHTFTSVGYRFGTLISPTPLYRSKLAIKLTISSWDVTMNPTET